MEFSSRFLFSYQLQELKCGVNHYGVILVPLRLFFLNLKNAFIFLILLHLVKPCVVVALLLAWDNIIKKYIIDIQI